MARIFRQGYTQKQADGTRKTKQSAKWYVEYVDVDGIRRRVPGYKDKKATEQLAARLEREASRRSVGAPDESCHVEEPALVAL